jgi:K+-sensing histidine kinase KdpD
LLDKASEIARLESGEVKSEMAPHAIGELVSTALVDCKRVSRVRPIHGEVKHEDLLADLPWARSVLVQLIVNAHLYSWPGQPITISSERKSGFALLNVADQGPGFEKAEAARIFGRFYRCKDQKIRANGTGMGLPIGQGNYRGARRNHRCGQPVWIRVDLHLQPATGPMLRGWLGAVMT